MRSGKIIGSQPDELSLCFEVSLLRVREQAEKLLPVLNKVQQAGTWTDLRTKLWLRSSFYSLVKKQFEVLLLSEALLSTEAPPAFFCNANLHLNKVFSPLSDLIIASDVSGLTLWREPVIATRGYLLLFEEMSESLVACSSRKRESMQLS